MAVRQVVEAPVGALRPPLAGERARRVLFLAAVGIRRSGVGVEAGQVLVQDEVQPLAPVLEVWHRELRHAQARQALGVVLPLHPALAHPVGVVRRGGRAYPLGPGFELPHTLGADLLQGVVVGGAQLAPGGIGTGVPERLGREGIERARQARVLERLERLVQAERPPRGRDLLLDARAGRATRLGDLRQVALACAGDESYTRALRRRTRLG